MKNFWLLVVLAGALTASGCAMERVKPWERDLLAQKPMQLDAYPVDNALDEHIYFSKEASSGGAGIGGGGCGCN
jgi:hypothetical protein